jgi:hypothetical protein
MNENPTALDKGRLFWVKKMFCAAIVFVAIYRRRFEYYDGLFKNNPAQILIA